MTVQGAEVSASRAVKAGQPAARGRSRAAAVGWVVWRYARTLIPAAAIWYLIATMVGNGVILPTPIAVINSLAGAASDGTLPASLGISLARLGIGFGLAIVIGLPLGMAMGLSESMRALIDPMVELFRPISGIAWIPLALLLFGVGDSIIIFIIFYGCVFPIVLNSVAGVREVDQNLIQAARTLGVNRIRIIGLVILPGALPTIVTGARIGLGTGWMSLVAAELVGANSGLGFSVQYYSTVLRTPLMMGYIAVIGILGLITNLVLLGVQRMLTPWDRSED